ncbi:MAG: DUF4125 family protein [Lachnospiraceae bacterium]|nr:DUF4125 family protein [Lachnospiraceae bacterium]
MNVEKLMNQVNVLLEGNQYKEAERLLLEGLKQAGDTEPGAALRILNELLGYYRETGQHEKSYEVAEKALKLAEGMGLAGSVPYGTTLQNVANAYRAGGRLQESLRAYEEAEVIYAGAADCDEMVVAGLYNNKSLLYQEMEAFDKAKKELEKALKIVETCGASFETATTYTNLSGSCLQLGEKEEALQYARKAVEVFEAMQVRTTHYCAALTALGSCFYATGEYNRAQECFRKALGIMEQKQEAPVFMERVKERIRACEDAVYIKGMKLCREYYEAYGAPMIEEQFGEYAHLIAVGLAGEGSECFGYDDAVSADHDCGPGFCMWLTDDLYEEIGSELQHAYDQLPKEYKGYVRSESAYGKGRRGVSRIGDFLERLTGARNVEEIDRTGAEDSGLAAVINGEIFRDDSGVFTGIRHELAKGYPLRVQYLKIAQAAAEFTQGAQYNYKRMMQRGQKLTAGILLSDGMKAAMKLQHYLENRYPVHDKWLYQSLFASEAGKQLAALLQRVESSRAGAVDQTVSAIEAVAEFIALQMYARGFISDSTAYPDVHVAELLWKSSVAECTVEELAEQIADIEFRAFDKVRNVGGRASCQNDRGTFFIMRKSQYLTWNHTMLLQYYYDFSRELERGHNLIEEKYGRMMASTAPDEYREMKERFPEISPEKQQIIEQIVQMQVAWMEEFALEYPAMAGRARSIRTGEDNLYNTSYETYLRGEISTYSDKMLELYGRYVVEYANSGKNPAYDIMTHTARFYGYEGVAAAEASLKGNT